MPPAPAADQTARGPWCILHYGSARNGLAYVLDCGFIPSSSPLVRNLIPALADRYHVVAPDPIGFGCSPARVTAIVTQIVNHSSRPRPRSSPPMLVFSPGHHRRLGGHTRRPGYRPRSPKGAMEGSDKRPLSQRHHRVLCASGAETVTMNVLESPRDDAAKTSPKVSAAGDRLISELDAAASVFLTTRPRLFAIGLRVLGDVGEAEDLVQEAWLRWARADHSVVTSPPAFLAITTTRLAINVAQSARRRRETSAGPWLPHTVDRSVSPETAAERHEAVDVAVRLLLEKLTPAERAAYLLRIAFDYPHQRIAEILHLNADHTRQLVRRAHQHIATERRQPVDATAHRRLVQTFLAAAQTGDLAELEELLAADVVRQVRRPRLEGEVRFAVVGPLTGQAPSASP